VLHDVKYYAVVNECDGNNEGCSAFAMSTAAETNTAPTTGSFISVVTLITSRHTVQ